MNAETITLQDCIENYEYKDTSVVINDGKIVGFSKENSPYTAQETKGATQQHLYVIYIPIICRKRGIVKWKKEELQRLME